MKKTIFVLFCLLVTFFAKSQQWATTGNDIYNTNSGNVGIGISGGLTEKLTINGSMQFFDDQNTYSYTKIRMLNRLSILSTGNPNNDWNRGLIGQGITWDNLNNVWSVDGGAYSDFAAVRFDNGGAMGFYTRPTTGSSYTLTQSAMDAYKRISIASDGRVGIGRNPEFQFDVVGISRFGAANNTNANVIIQGGGGAGYTAWWITGATGFLQIGGHGYTEPSMGAINIDNGGNVSIGTTNNFGYKLAVNGHAIFTEAKVKLYANWPDYVFHKDYNLMPLDKLETFIRQNNHLPNLPSAKEVEKNGGIELGNMSAKLLEKIEELTLYIIELKKENSEILKHAECLKK